MSIWIFHKPKNDVCLQTNLDFLCISKKLDFWVFLPSLVFSVFFVFLFLSKTVDLFQVFYSDTLPERLEDDISFCDGLFSEAMLVSWDYTIHRISMEIIVRESIKDIWSSDVDFLDFRLLSTARGKPKMLPGSKTEVAALPTSKHDFSKFFLLFFCWGCISWKFNSSSLKNLTGRKRKGSSLPPFFRGELFIFGGRIFLLNHLFWTPFGNHEAPRA